ncbi:MAG: glycoside hydrolase family 28 protein [Gammaproteobacteria bacterium]
MRRLTTDRRRVLQLITATGIAGSLASVAGCLSPKTATTDWAEAQRIRGAIRPPRIPSKDFDLRTFGAKANHDASAAMQDAITACRQAGGGRIVVDGGRYPCGPIHLGSHMELHIARNATLAFIPEPERYLPPVLTHWEGLEFMGYSPLIYAFGETDIAITGEGTLDGGADASHWWHWKGGEYSIGKPHEDQKFARTKLMADAENEVPVGKRVYADGAYLRPPFIQTFRCANVLIEDVTIQHAPFWLINPVLCRDVIVRGVTCESLGPNSDGCNPESCFNVLIEKCRFNTGDDCIAIKSGRNADGRRIATPCENIVITDCDMQAGHGGVVIGSEISGGVRNIFAENCRMSSPDLERAIRIKTNSVRGGVIEHLRYRNITVGDVRDAIVINYFYEEGDAGQFDPLVRDVLIENLNIANARKVFEIRGFDRDPIQDLTLRNVNVAFAGAVGVVEHVARFTTHNVTINGRNYSAN